MRRNMLLCPSVWEEGQTPPGMANHAVGSLASIIESANYPFADSAHGLDSYTIQGATLYHKLFHLSDTKALPTGDPYGMYLLFISLFTLLRFHLGNLPAKRLRDILLM